MRLRRTPIPALQASAAYSRQAHMAASANAGLEQRADLEVEKKFAVTTSMLSRLSDLTTTLQPNRKLFVDTYYDDIRFSLTTRDMWLRRREIAFELKWPRKLQQASNSNSKAEISGIDFYNESTEWKDMAQVLEQMALVKIVRPLPSDTGSSAPSTVPNSNSKSASRTDAWLAACGLQRFASIHTQRTRYKLHVPLESASSTNDDAFHAINLDIDDVGYDVPPPGGAVSPPHSSASPSPAPSQHRYQIGEVELHSIAKGYTAEQAMRDAFSYLHIDCNQREVRGKVLEYIARFRPEHYAALEASGLLAAKLRS